MRKTAERTGITIMTPNARTTAEMRRIKRTTAQWMRRTTTMPNRWSTVHAGVTQGRPGTQGGRYVPNDDARGKGKCKTPHFIARRDGENEDTSHKVYVYTTSK